VVSTFDTELLCIRKTRALWFFRLVWRGTPHVACRQRVRRSCLIRHFGSLKALARASFQELRQFLPRRKAEAVLAALSMPAVEEAEYARSNKLDDPESIYKACSDMKLFNQEVLRLILLDSRFRHTSNVEITKSL
jgi:DNA repair protein RadC